MYGTILPTMCQILVVTQLNFKNVLEYYLHCFTDMALHSRDAVTVSARLLRDHTQTAAVWKTIADNTIKWPYQPKHSPSSHHSSLASHYSLLNPGIVGTRFIAIEVISDVSRFTLTRNHV